MLYICSPFVIALTISSINQFLYNFMYGDKVKVKVIVAIFIKFCHHSSILFMDPFLAHLYA